MTADPDLWIAQPAHRAALAADARRQVDFFRASLGPGPGFRLLAHDGSPLPDSVQALHTTTRLVHSYALAKLAGLSGCDAVIDRGMDYLWQHHRDAEHGGYLWALDGTRPHDTRKLAYGHVFVLLAGASARLAGHPDADRLIADVWQVIDSRYWDEERGLLLDEWARDWTPFSAYRGMNANMHGTEALLALYEATGETRALERAGRILDFFLGTIAPAHGWRIPEHYTADWQVDPDYAGDPMFRPPGTTPGHSFEMARLLLQHWDLAGRPGNGAPDTARRLVQRALDDAWDDRRGGIAYTVGTDGVPAIRTRFWWPVTEALGALASLLKIDPDPADEAWYRRLWTFAESRLIDAERGGWYPELADDDSPAESLFPGKPDIYHSLQAVLFPLAPGVSRQATGVSLDR